MTASESPWPQPLWLAEIKNESQRETERVKLLLRIACLYFSQKGNSGTLAEAIGLTPNAFNICRTRGQVSPTTAVAIERELGRELFPREAFRPDLFVIED